MPTLGSFSAWVEVDGRPLREFGIFADPSGRKVSCHVPSDAGKQFVVHWEDHGHSFTAAWISCDGYVIPGRYLSGPGRASRGGARSGLRTERPFTFSELPKTCKHVTEILSFSYAYFLLSSEQKCLECTQLGRSRLYSPFCQGVGGARIPSVGQASALTDRSLSRRGFRHRWDLHHIC